MSQIPENVDTFIELLRYLIRPLPEHGFKGEVYTTNFYPLDYAGHLVKLDQFPRILDPHVTNYFISEITKSENRGLFNDDFVRQAFHLLYTYARALGSADHQMIAQHRGITRLVDGKYIREIKLYDHREESSRWYLKSPKYYNYNSHVTVARYDPTLIVAAEKEKVLDSLRRIKFQSQKRSYLRHLELVGDSAPDFKKTFTRLQRLNYIADTDDEADLPMPKKQKCNGVQGLNLNEGIKRLQSYVVKYCPV